MNQGQNQCRQIQIQKKTNHELFQSINAQNSIKQCKKWTDEDEELLLNLHKYLGCKWTKIAQYYPGSSENLIKNHFYSRMRKSIRKLNNLISVLFQKKYDKFSLKIVFDLSNISSGKIQKKQKIDPQIYSYYQTLLYDIIEITEKIRVKYNLFIQIDQYEQKKTIQNLILGLIALENIFRLTRGNRIAKGKKKNIAYLRQYRFPLYVQNKVDVVITKQNIYLQYSHEKNQLTVNINQGQQEKQPRKEQNQCQDFQKQNFMLENQFTASGKTTNDDLCLYEMFQDYYQEQEMKCFGIYYNKPESFKENIWRNMEEPIQQNIFHF